MYSKFENLSEEKRLRILNAGLCEFATNGYSNSSTDVIVNQAGISKGALFHYFKSKHDFFLYLYKYSIDVMTQEFYSKFDIQKTDIIDLFMSSVEIKIPLVKKYPAIYEFMIKASYHDDEVFNEIQEQNKVFIEEAYAKILANIDFSVFREDVTTQQCINIIRWTIDGCQQEIIGFEKLRSGAFNEFDFDSVMQKAESYLQTLKKILYKGE